MLLETLMEVLFWRWKWNPLKRSLGESQVCVCVCHWRRTKPKRKDFLKLMYFLLIMWVLTGADLSDYFNYGFNEDTWKAYCEKQKRLRMGLEVSTVGSVTSKITVRSPSWRLCQSFPVPLMTCLLTALPETMAAAMRSFTEFPRYQGSSKQPQDQAVCRVREFIMCKKKKIFFRHLSCHCCRHGLMSFSLLHHTH